MDRGLYVCERDDINLTCGCGLGRDDWSDVPVLVLDRDIMDRWSCSLCDFVLTREGDDRVFCLVLSPSGDIGVVNVEFLRRVPRAV